MEEFSTVELTLDDDQVVNCEILTILEQDEKSYIALLPLTEDNEPNEAGEVYLYRFIEKDGEEPELENIIEDEEYEIVADLFDQWLDSEEFEDMEEH